MLIIQALYLHFVMDAGVLAYVGPGLGAGTVALILGFFASIFLALFAVLWYPIKRLFEKMNKAKSNTPTNT